MTVPANSRQVGGDHYGNRTQPWDFIIDNKLNFCSAAIVKYLARWERKGNYQDLDKAQHYFDKLKECIKEGRITPALSQTQSAVDLLLNAGQASSQPIEHPFNAQGRWEGVKKEKERIAEENRTAARSCSPCDTAA